MYATISGGMEYDADRKGVIIGGCVTGRRTLENIAEVLRKSGQVHPEKVSTFTFPQAMRQRDRLERASARAVMVTHGEGILALNHTVRPSIIVACNAPELIGSDTEGRRPRTFRETWEAVRRKHRHNVEVANRGYRPHREAYREVIVDSFLQGLPQAAAYFSHMRAIGRLSTRDHLRDHLERRPNGHEVQVIAVVSPNDEFYPYRQGDLDYGRIQVHEDRSGHDALLTTPHIVLRSVFDLIEPQDQTD